MWFLKTKLSKDQIDGRLFEFKGAVQTCNLNVIKFSLNVLTVDLGTSAKESNFFKEIENFGQNSVLGGLSKGGTGRKILYRSFENLLNSVKLTKAINLNEFNQMPHGFSCPLNTNFNNIDFQSFWINKTSLKLHLDKVEVNLRLQKFTDFIMDENYNNEILNRIKWHDSELTSDLVSGSVFAGDSPRLKSWVQFSDAIQYLGKSNLEQKSKAINEFENMIKTLPYNNFQKS